jgi:hypothetical protein
MTDDILISDLTLDDDNSVAERQPALVVPARATQAELLVLEEMFRMSPFPGTGEMMFIDVDEETGEEMFVNAERWQVLMKWPRLPTISEADAWQANAEARLLATYWDRLRAAKESDAAKTGTR